MSASELAIFGGTPVLREEDHRTWPQVEEEERKAVLTVLERGILSGGGAPESRAFEREFAASHKFQSALPRGER